MTSIGDFFSFTAVFVAPALLITTFVLLLVARQPRWVTLATLTCAVVATTGFISYWYLWGKAFDYADANRSVPAALDQATNIALVVWVLPCLLVVALGTSRLVAERRSRRRSAAVPIA